MESDSKLSARVKMEKAYFDLLETKHYSKITVSDIIAKAQISRTTFYRHYVDIFDMHEKIADRLGETIIGECLKKVLLASSEEEYFSEILRIFNSQEKYIVLISGENGSRYFFESMFNKATNDIFPSLAHLSEDQLFRLKFMVMSAVGVYVKDILDSREHDPQFINICKKLLNFEELFGGNYAKQC